MPLKYTKRIKSAPASYMYCQLIVHVKANATSPTSQKIMGPTRLPSSHPPCLPLRQMPPPPPPLSNGFTSSYASHQILPSPDLMPITIPIIIPSLTVMTLTTSWYVFHLYVFFINFSWPFLKRSRNLSFVRV